MAPRGLLALLKTTASARLVGKGARRFFRNADGRVCRGITKALARYLWSSGTLPKVALTGSTKRLGWRGVDGGRKRGTAVDAQLTRVVNKGIRKPKRGQ